MNHQPVQKPRSKKAYMKAMIALASEGHFEEAMQFDKYDVVHNAQAQQDFFHYMEKDTCNDNILHFVKTFDHPDWFACVEKMSWKSYADFIGFCENNAVNLYQKNVQGKNLVDVWLDKQEGNMELKKSILYTLQYRPLSNAFITGEAFDNVVQWLAQGLYDAGRLHYHEDKKFTHAVMTALNNGQVIESDNYKKLFEEPNLFLKTLFDGPALKTVQDLMEHNKRFMEPYHDMLLSTALAKKMVSNSEMEEAHVALAKEMIVQQKFKPNIALLPIGFQEAWREGRVTQMNERQYFLYKDMMKAGLVDLDMLNNPSGDRNTYFESFIYNNINSQRRNQDMYEFMDKIIDELHQLMAMGIEAKCVRHSKEGVLKLLNEDVFDAKRYGRRINESLDVDIMEFSHEAGLHPRFIKMFCDFVEQRYGLEPKNKADMQIQKQSLEAKQESLRQKCNDLLDKTVFTLDQAKENNQGKKLGLG